MTKIDERKMAQPITNYGIKYNELTKTLLLDSLESRKGQNKKIRKTPAQGIVQH